MKINGTSVPMAPEITAELGEEGTDPVSTQYEEVPDGHVEQYVEEEYAITPQERTLSLENTILKMDARLDRLVDHVNREIGVAGEVPLVMRLDRLVTSVQVALVGLDRIEARLEALEKEPRVVHDVAGKIAVAYEGVDTLFGITTKVEARIAVLEAEALKNFAKIKEKTRLLD